MPPPPAFDYYHQLELDQTATIDDIKGSYRRLARIHHPDKNPENLVAATAAFQKIQTAYETLSEERSRAIYDARSSRSTTRPSNGRSPFDSEDDSFEEYSYDEEDIGMTFEDFMQGRFAGAHHPGFSSQGFGGFQAFFYDGNFGFYTRRMSPEEMRKQRHEREAAEAAHRKRMGDEARQRREREEGLAKDREMARQAEEKQRMMEKERREMAERVKNEEIWVAENATTQEQKQRLCLHSEVWAKERSQKKIKCEACGQKRGMVSHRCPHCALLACQVCINLFNKLRKAP
ncbi:DnaJ-domain-containing protein [Stipitochalara longipes BDJ]|nr:DnaJ-domain-containing protein [Stipitochalara longipes BDJ]